MRTLGELLAELQRRGIQLRLNPEHGRLEFSPFDALDEEPDLFDELLRERRGLEQILWARQRQPKGERPPVKESELGVDEPFDESW